MAKSAPKTLTPTALSIADTAVLLSKASGKLVSEAQVQADVESGAPTNADGTLNLVHYAAWLIGKIHHGD